MKLICLIFTVYLSALAVYPCYDNCDDEIASVTQQADNDSEESCELCSPFCISACCAIYSIANPEFISIAITESNESYTDYTLKSVPLVTITIWQPPKIA